MNIFVTDHSPTKSAIALCDKRLIKMVLETAQLLSTAVNECGGQAPYKTSHKNHPCTVWTRQSKSNFQWLLDHGYALGLEYTHRFKKTHKSFTKIVDIDKDNLIKYIPEGTRTPFVNCAANQSKGVSYKHIQEVTEAYKLYLIDRWNEDIRTPKWTNRQPPTWVGHLKSNNKFFRLDDYTITFNNAKTGKELNVNTK